MEGFVLLASTAQSDLHYLSRVMVVNSVIPKVLVNRLVIVQQGIIAPFKQAVPILLTVKLEMFVHQGISALLDQELQYHVTLVHTTPHQRLPTLVHVCNVQGESTVMARASTSPMGLVMQGIIVPQDSHLEHHPCTPVRKVTVARKALIDQKDAHQDTTKIK